MSVSGIELYTTPGSERSCICLLAVSICIPLQELSGHLYVCIQYRFVYHSRKWAVMYMSVSGIDLHTTPGSERSCICLLVVAICIPLQEVSGHVYVCTWYRFAYHSRKWAVMYMSVSGIDLYTTPGRERSWICLLAVSICIRLQEMSDHVYIC
jgi:hypothetical protein